MPILTPASTVSSKSSAPATRRPSRPCSSYDRPSSPSVVIRERLGSDGALINRPPNRCNIDKSRSRSPISRAPVETVRINDHGQNETILAGNITHTVETTILEEGTSIGQDSTIRYDGECSTTQYIDKTIDLDNSKNGTNVDEEQSNVLKLRENDLNREMLRYANRYHPSTMLAMGNLSINERHNKVQQVLASQELQDLIARHTSGAVSQTQVEVVGGEGVCAGTSDAIGETDEDDDVEEEPEFTVDQLELAKKILKQRQGLESSEDSDSDEDMVYDNVDGSVIRRAPHKKRETRKKKNIFVPNIPPKIRRKYVDKKIEMERAKYRARIKSQKMASIRIAVPQKPTQQFATPQQPVRGPGKHSAAAAARATPKPKKAKMSNVQMSIVQPPLPLHQLQGHMSAPTKITAVPNVAAGFHQNQQQLYSDMAQAPQSTPIRTTPQPGTGSAPQAQTPQSHLAQLGQFVNGANQQQAPQQQGMYTAAQLQAMQAAVAQTAQAAQAAYAAEAAYQAQVAQQARAAPPQQLVQRQVPVGHPGQVNVPMPAQMLNQGNPQMAVNPAQAQMMDERRKMEEVNAVYHLMQSRGQFPPTNQELFQVQFAQAQADLRSAAAQAAQAAQAQAQMTNMRAQAEAVARQQAMMKQEQARAQAAAKEAARLKAETEAAKAKVQAEAEARRKAEQEMRVRQAQAAQTQAAQAQAQSQAHAQNQAQTQAIVEIQRMIQSGQPLSMQQMQQLQQMSQVQMQHAQQVQQMQQMQMQQLQMQQFAARMQQGTPKPAVSQQAVQQGMPAGIQGMPTGMGMQQLQGLGMPGMQLPQQAGQSQQTSQAQQQQLFMQLQLQQQQLMQHQLQQQLQMQQHQQHQQQQQQIQMQQQQQLAQQGLVPNVSSAWLQQQAQLAQQQQQVVQQNLLMRVPSAQTPVAPRAPTVAPQSVVQQAPAPATPIAISVATTQVTRPETVEPFRSISSGTGTGTERINNNVELELWPTNGYSEKKRKEGSQASPIFGASAGDSTFYHVACLIRSRSACNADDVGSLWVLRLEDQTLLQFQLQQTLAEAQRFVGKQHLVIFYDDVMSGEVQQSKEYVINREFKPSNRQIPN
ncbi:E3 ubiquitin-protein ligase RING2 homolog spat-3 [Caenorhabditis elegans]|nr:E3 ubiquitin-protein ligase RING2 homolog spat-3 [Caenorhabditis elegans]CCD63269.1 E3 ubiquitin-protein ligase RING2 homolog spat-3 [Caenorhabditis elegans]|eukprot:NP_001024905.1 Suppressor of PAr-Two defect [Caenorhabditis elegans]